MIVLEDQVKEEFLWGAMRAREERVARGEITEELIPPAYNYEDLKAAFEAGIMFQRVRHSAEADS